MKYWIETWGCQMNQLDSARLSGNLLKAGMEAATALEEADLFLLNTCSVREKAEDKVFARLGELKAWKRKGAERRIGLCGCIAQQYGETLLKKSPLLDFVFGPGEVDQIAHHIALGVAVSTRHPDAVDYDPAAVDRSGEVVSMVTVMEGCSQGCSFCIVPRVRGRARSREAGPVEAEVRALLDRGHDDILLLGQVINAYRDPVSGTGFTDLLDRLAALPGLRNLAFVTSHPALFDPCLPGVLRDRSVISRYFHMPLQSGSDRILKAMRRRHTRATYLEIAGRLQEAVPGIALSSDFIVGYPGETDADFEDTLDMIRRVRFASLYAFAYSPRPGTIAAREADDVPAVEKNRRLNELLRMHDAIQREENGRLVGSILEAHVVQPGRDGGTWTARTRCNRVAHFPAPPDRAVSRGAWVQVRITEGLPHSLRAELA
jgi:tRNA-2-methylthio-N6-dimethylallyladenosine synthase